ncbi:MAG: Transcription factor S [Promethearchaeota archaeon]|jgi:DNA-directed RNA polymerase subunit M|nr:MAG: Transcription factor S [Candidatus Lokiarchaeota archaeon]
MVEFCPECGSLLRTTKNDGETFLVCRCGYEKKENVDEEEVKKEVERKKKELEKKFIVVKNEDKITVNPTVSKTCPKCGHNEAEAWQEQTRSADESSTSFFRCTKCKYTWREY